MNGIVKMLCRRSLVCCRQPLSYSYVTAMRRNNNQQIEMSRKIKSRSFKTSVANLSSSLFVSDRTSDTTANFSFDHGLKAQLKDKELLKLELRQRGLDINVDKLEKDYLLLLDLHAKKERLEENREDIARQVAEIVKQKKADKTKSEELTAMMKSLVQDGKEIKQSLKDLSSRYWDIEERVMLTALSLPNSIKENVPSDFEILEEHFTDKIPTTPVDHYQLLEQSKDVKLSNVGIKAYYLRGRLAVLEQKLIQNICSQLRGQNFIQMLAPEMFKTPVVEASGLDICDPASVYRLQTKQGTKQLSDWDHDLLFLRGASPLSFVAYFSKMMIRLEDLPTRLFTVGRNYCPDKHGNENRPGLFGALQSTKVHVCGLCSSKKDSGKLAAEFVSCLTSMYKQFSLPFRLVNIGASSLTNIEQNRTELQIWIPSMNKYEMVASVSECSDYSSRRLMIRQSDNNHLATSSPVNMVHGEVIDITKMIAILLEYGQTDIELKDS